jgi:hypothetical protein
MNKEILLILLIFLNFIANAQSNAQKFYDSGLDHLKYGDFLKAIGDFTSAISINNQFADAYYQRAIAKEQMAKKLGFENSELCYDLVYALKLGHEQASAMLLKSSCLNQCYDLKLAVLDPEIVFCADFNSKFLFTLPNEVAKMDFLIKLNLFNNKLNKFPKELSNCKSLLLLDISSNKLTELDGQLLKNLHYLKELNLAKNELIELPKEIGTLKKLTLLNLRSNKIKSLPNEIGELESLEILDLSLNELSSLPDQFYRLKNLKNLYLTGNKLSKKDIKLLQEKLPGCKIYYDD